MAMDPLRTLLHGYGAAIAAAAVAAPFLGTLGAVLTAWIGGALLTLLFAALRQPVEADLDERDLAAASLARFAEDRLADRASPAAARKAS